MACSKIDNQQIQKLTQAFDKVCLLLKCNVCQQILTRTVELACSHCFCEGCYQGIAKKASVRKCPVCQQVIKKKTGVYKNAINDGVGSVLAAFHKTIKAKYDVDLLATQTPATPLKTKNSTIWSPSKTASRYGRKYNPSPNTRSKSSKENVFDSLMMAPEKPVASSKGKTVVLRWLNDNQNKFDRVTQTQQPMNSQNDESQGPLFSVSQAKNFKKVSSIRSRSLDNYVKKVCKPKGQRHSICTDTLQDMCVVNVEKVNVRQAQEKIIKGILEDEFLNNLEREMDGGSKLPSPSGWDRLRDINNTIKKKVKSKSKTAKKLEVSCKEIVNKSKEEPPDCSSFGVIIPSEGTLEQCIALLNESCNYSSDVNLRNLVQIMRNSIKLVPSRVEQGTQTEQQQMDKVIQVDLKPSLGDVAIQTVTESNDAEMQTMESQEGSLIVLSDDMDNLPFNTNDVISQPMDVGNSSDQEDEIINMIRSHKRPRVIDSDSEDFDVIKKPCPKFAKSNISIKFDSESQKSGELSENIDYEDYLDKIFKKYNDPFDESTINQVIQPKLKVIATKSSETIGKWRSGEKTQASQKTQSSKKSEDSQNNQASKETLPSQKKTQSGTSKFDDDGNYFDDCCLNKLDEEIEQYEKFAQHSVNLSDIISESEDLAPKNKPKSHAVYNKKVVRNLEMHDFVEDDHIFSDEDIIDCTPPRDAIVDDSDVLPPPPEFCDQNQISPPAPLQSATSTPISKYQIENVHFSPAISQIHPLNRSRSTTNMKILSCQPGQSSLLNFVTTTPSRASQSKSKPHITSTRLNKDQLFGISTLAHKKIITYSSTFSDEVTHLIGNVDLNNYVEEHTMKFILAVASGLWVLNYQWVKDCLAQNRIVPEAPYEALDGSGIPGPKISRLTRLTNPLFRNFKFFCMPPFQSASKADVEKVLRLLDGKVVDNLTSMAQNNGLHGIIVSEIIGTQDFDIYEKYLEDYNCITVDLEWVIKSVAQYRLTSVRPYLLCSEESLENLQYPAPLLEVVPLTATEDN